MKRVISWVLLVCIVVALCPIRVSASTVASGNCGADVKWKFLSDGTLVLSGTGSTDDWGYSGYIQMLEPWLNYEERILKVIVEEGVNRIGDYAFSCCHKLTSVSLPSSLTIIGDGVFYCCGSLTKIEIPETVMEIGKAVFGECGKLTEVKLPSTLTKISESMFESCAALEKVHIPETVVRIDSWAFDGCAKLKEIDIPDGVTRIGSYVFANCRSLTEVILPQSLQFMGNSVFSGYTGVKNLVIPASVTEMAHTFENAYELENITFLGDSPIWGGAVFNNITLTVYYPSNNSTWTEDFLQDYGGNVTWVGYESDRLPNPVVASGSYGNINWSISSDYTLRVSGEGEMWPLPSDQVWGPWKYKIEKIIIEEGLTSLSDMAFAECRTVESIQIANSVEFLEHSCFIHCAELKEITLPSCLKKLDGAFYGCVALEKMYFQGDAPEFGELAFRDLSFTAYYPGNNETWTEDVLQDYGGEITWIPDNHSHQYGQKVIKATCTEEGYTIFTCTTCGHEYVGNYMDPTGHKWENITDSVKNCAYCSAVEGGYRVALTETELNGASSVWIDGVEYPVHRDNSGCAVYVLDTNARTMVTYLYNDPNAADIHTQYPTQMYVHMLRYTNGGYQVTYLKEFDNLLQYAGSSIRIVGKKGIRMITSINKTTKKSLTGAGIKGYTLEEYGTALAWAKDLEGGNPLVLGQPYTKSNYAYKKGKADPVYKTTDKLVQYTNVLVGFTDDQCVDDIAMRPYIKLKAPDGSVVTIYGGIVYRSIGYIAYQNRNAFKPKTDAYKYVWGIIHHVYGKKYDADYKG